MKKTIIILICCYLTAFFGSAESDEEFYSSLLGKDLYNTLLKEGEVSCGFIAENPPTLMPDLPEKKRFLEEIREKKPTVGTEIIFYKKLTGYPIPPRVSLLEIFNAMSAISTLEGVKFYDPRMKKNYTFFHELFVVDENNDRIPDPRLTKVPDYRVLDILIKDPFIGYNPYLVEFKKSGGSLIVSMTNKKNINLLIFPLIKAGNLRAVYIIIPHNNKLVFYGYNWMKAEFFHSLARLKNGELRERVRAIYLWLLRAVM